MCPSCQSIVGAGQSHCAVCGSAVAATPTEKPPAPDRETLRFANAILKRPHKFTLILLFVNFFVFLLMWQSGNSLQEAIVAFDRDVLLAYGAKLNLLVRESDHWWRLVTPMFLHVNLFHVLINMYALWMLGPYVEKLYGSAKFVAFWVLTGIAGLLASYWTVVSPETASRLGTLGRFLLKTSDEASAGASGALFGLVGVLFVFGIKFRHELPDGFKRAFGTGLAPMILLNLLIGYLGRGFIDNAAHFGGLVAGAGLALIAGYERPGQRSKPSPIWRVLQVAAIAIVLVSFVQTARHFRDPLPARVVANPLTREEQERADSLRYFSTLTTAQEALTFYINDENGSLLDAGIARLDSLPSLEPEADKLRERLRQMLVVARGPRGRFGMARPTPKDRLEKRNQLAKEFTAWAEDYENWLKTTGGKYGVKFVGDQQ